MKTFLISVFATLTAVSTQLQAQTDEELRAMQQSLNKEVMEKPFSVEDEAKIDAFIKSAMAKDLKPETTQAPKGWKPGFTCADIYSYGWNSYRNCRHYRSYYGQYWQ